MILGDEVLIKYKGYLTSLEYPFIKDKTDDEIKKIFEDEYREFLLSWIFTKLIPGYSLKLEEAKKSNKIEQVLGNILYENGFCRASEKEPFVKGNLSNGTQLLIFDRMFNMLSKLYTNNLTKENMTANDITLKHVFMKPTKEEFNNRILQDVTLLPTHGLTNKITDNEKQVKINFIKAEIERLERILENTCETNNDTLENQKENRVTFSANQVETLTSKFLETASNFKSEDFVNISCGDPTINKFALENCVSSNSQVMNNVLKILQKKCDLNFLMSNEEVFDHDISLSHENDYFACILQNYAMSGNILQEINRNSEEQ